MKLDLTEIALCSGKRHTYVINEPPMGFISDETENDMPIKGELTFSNTGSSICVRGSFETGVLAVCSRCLEPYRIEIADRIDEVLPLEGETSDDELYLDDGDSPIYRNNIFDLSELLRQCILVLVPSWGICSSDCKGLCPVCGTDLNKNQCSCSRTTGENTPFAVLRELMDNNED